MTRAHLVFVLPGIGGSVLTDSSGETVWDASLTSLARLVMQPQRLSLAEAGHLRPTGAIHSRQLLPGWTVVHGYERLIAGLARLPGAIVGSCRPGEEAPKANIIVFPYDFRRSIAESAALLDSEVRRRLSQWGGDPTGRVIVVAHSMGGLVARYWMGPLEGWPVCRALITLGTPHRGAPKALRLLVNGVWGGMLSSVTTLVREWPSIYELLPFYKAIWDESAGVARYPHQLPVAWLSGPAHKAFSVHEDIERAWQHIPASKLHLDPRIGWSHPGPNAARWADGVLRVSKAPPTWLDLQSWADDLGDGTVPAFSAVPHELSTHSPAGWRVRQRHGPLAGADFVANMVEFYEQYRPLTTVRGHDRPTAIGLDVDEQYLAGTPVVFRADIRGDDIDPAGVTMHARLYPAGARQELASIRLPPDSDCFCGEIIPPGPGTYDLVVTAANVPGCGELNVSESFSVLNPHWIG